MRSSEDKAGRRERERKNERDISSARKLTLNVCDI